MVDLSLFIHFTPLIAHPSYCIALPPATASPPISILRVLLSGASGRTRTPTSAPLSRAVPRRHDERTERG